MGRRVAISIVLIMVSAQAFFIEGAASIEVFSDPLNLKYEGDQEILNSPYFLGGEGTDKDPVVLTGFPSNTSSLKISNSTLCISLMNHTFDTPYEGYHIDVENVSGLRLDNISALNDNGLVEIIDVDDLVIVNSSFTCSVLDIDRMSPVIMDQIRDCQIQNSSFRTSKIDHNALDNGYIFYSLNISIQGSIFDRADVLFSLSSNNGNLEVENCKFLNDTLALPRHYWGSKSSVISNCFFDQSHLDVRELSEIIILNNFFNGSLSYIRFGSFGYMPSTEDDYNWIKGNTFEKSRGLWVTNEYTGLKYMRNWKITGNYFGNSSHPAIDFLHTINIDFVFIWKNIFFHNHGTGNTYNNISQVDSVWGYYNSTGNTFQFHRNGIGNYWRDWTTPDNDTNGIVDMEYLIRVGSGPQYTTNITDPYPVANPYFDFTKPNLEFVRPEETIRSIDTEYVIVEWRSWDNESGIEEISISLDKENWTVVTGEDWWSLILDQGSNTIYLRSINRAGFTTIKSRKILVERINGPIELLSPEDGEILMDDLVLIEWNIDDEFNTSRLELQVDEVEVDVSIGENQKSVILDEGSHMVELDCWDEKETFISKKVEFIVDTIDPVIIPRSPVDGISYSSSLVNFNWSIYDRNGFLISEYRLDGEEWSEFQGLECTFSRLLDLGDHNLEIHVVDIAGRDVVKNINFSIKDGGLIINDPEEAHITKEEKIEVSWTIDQRFDTEKITVINIELGQKWNATGTDRILVDLGKDRNRISITAVDVHGNKISDMVTVYRDLEEPSISIINDDYWINSDGLIFTWQTFDDYGGDRQRWRLDGGDWTELIGPSYVVLEEPIEGIHVFEVEFYDIVGHRSWDSYEFFYDDTVPDIGFLSDHDTITTDPVVILNWHLADSSGIGSLKLSIEDTIYDLINTTREWNGVVKDGRRSITISATDLAGNMAKDTILLTVDTKDPSLLWTDGNWTHTSSDEITMKFTVEDEIGISMVDLFEDQKAIWTTNGSGDHEIVIELNEGIHDLYLTARDLSGRMCSIQRIITVDRTGPELRSFQHMRDDKKEILHWEAEDRLSLILKVIIEIDGRSMSFTSDEGSLELEDMPSGKYIVNITLVDELYNLNFTSKTIEIEGGGNDDEEGSQDRGGIFLFIIFITLILLLIGFGYFLRKRTQKDQEEMDNTHATDQGTEHNILPPLDRSRKLELGGQREPARMLSPTSISDEKDPGKIE